MHSASHSERGKRPYQEDRFITGFAEDGSFIGAIFDGHGGDSVASFCQAGFLETFKKNSGRADWGKAFTDTFECLHSQTKDLGLSDGAVSVAFRWTDSGVIVANVGDAEAAIVYPDRSYSLSSPHRLDDPDESRRVIAAGGIVRRPYVYNPLTGNGLMPTRSLGDHQFPWIIPTPAVRSEYWDKDSAPVALVAGCDGLWDVISPKSLWGYFHPDNDAEKACELLMKEALKKSTDNVTIIVVCP